MKLIATAAAITAVVVAPPGLAAYTSVWSTGFETGYFETVGPFPSFTLNVLTGAGGLESSGAMPGTGTQYFRNATSATTVFIASGLDPHTSIKLSFDLAFLDTWDWIDGSLPPNPRTRFRQPPEPLDGFDDRAGMGDRTP